jgi:amino acid transporter
MTVESRPSPEGSSSAERPAQAGLKRGTIGLVGVVFMVVAFSAPIAAMTGNLPVAVGFGNGTGAPAGFIIATIVLTIFSIGFVALARHITAAGAFYTFVSRGWSKIFGLPAGVMSMVTYMIMEAGLIGLFAAFASQVFSSQFGVDLPWQLFAFIGAVLIAFLSHKDISLAAKVLGIALVAEMAMLTISAVRSLMTGGPDGINWSSINPISAFSTNGVEGGVVGLGMLMAFWSWVGFESTAIYGEESKDPKKIVPRATLIAVIGIGVFYTFISWGMVTGAGHQAVALASGSDPFELLYTPTRAYVGEWGVVAFQWLVLGGSFACALATHNSAARYLFAFGRDRLMWHRLGQVHAKHGSPWIASLFQSAFAAVLLIVATVTNADPYGVVFVVVAILATLCLLIVQTMCSISCITYFHVWKQHPETANWWRTLVSPILGGLGMLCVIYLMLTNMEAVAGNAKDNPVFIAIPWVVGTMFVGSLALALYWRARKPHLYERIGSTIFDDNDSPSIPEPAAEVS